MPEVQVRKKVTAVEEIFHEGGPVATTPLRRAAAIAVIHNPFAGQYVKEISGFMDDLKPLGLRTNAKEAVHIDPAGKVGIGTASPQNALHVGPGVSAIAPSRVVTLLLRRSRNSVAIPGWPCSRRSSAWTPGLRGRGACAALPNRRQCDRYPTHHSRTPGCLARGHG